MTPFPALALLLLAQQPSPSVQPSADPAEKPKPAALAGRVLNAKTEEPLRRANVTLRSILAPGPLMNTGPMRPDAPYAAVTDGEGKFRIEGIDPGTYRLSVDRQGFVRSEYGAKPGSLNGVGTAIHLAASSELKNLDVKLMPQGVLVGRVFDDEGEPLANVRVQAWQRRYVRGKRQLAPLGGGQTNDIGEFRLAGLRPGSYWVSAEQFNPNRMWGEGPPRNLAGQPEEEFASTYYPGVADAAAARPLEVAAGQVVQGVDIRMRKQRVFRVRGKIAGPAATLRNARVVAIPRDSRSRVILFGGPGSPTKEDGSFELGSVAPGEYYLTLMTSGPNAPTGRVAVDVTTDNVERVLLPLATPTTVTGVVRVEGDTPDRPTALTGAGVRLAPIEETMFGGSGGALKEDGSFTLDSVAPDRYRLYAFSLPPGLWLKSVRAGEQDVLDSGFDVAPGSPLSLQVVLGKGTGTVTGTVQNAEQKPAAGAMVTLGPDPWKDDRFDLTRSTTTDQNGQFKFEGLAPGDYRVYAWTEIDPGAALDPEFTKPHESKSERLSVKASGQHSVSLKQIVVESP